MKLKSKFMNCQNKLFIVKQTSECNYTFSDCFTLFRFLEYFTGYGNIHNVKIFATVDY
jgi:hypothetical protein